jgi:hypothetical protein
MKNENRETTTGSGLKRGSVPERKKRWEDDLKLYYLIGATKVIFSNGVVLRLEDFNRWKKSGVLASRFYQALLNPKCSGYDFDHALTTGFLRRKKGAPPPDWTGAKAAKEEILRDMEEMIGDAAEPAAQEAAPAPAPASEKAEIFFSGFLVEAVMTCIGAGSAVMSAYHTTAFLISGGKPFWTAALTGAMMILFSAMAFTAARYFFRERGAVKLFGAVFTVLGLMVVSYSIFSTLTVNFDQFKERSEADAAAVSAAVGEGLREQAGTDAGREALADMAAEIETLEAEAAYWRDKSWRRYDDAAKALAGARSRRAALRDREQVRREAAEAGAEEEVRERTDTIYAFLSRLFRLREEAIRFIVYVIPSCFYDIIAPFSLSVVLLIEDNRKKRYLLG